MEQPILTISMLVSGREETTERSLASLRGLLEQLNSELILVDTGCSEALRERLRQYTDQIIPFVWCNDFAKARNAGLARARGEWFLFLDDDEWFEDVTPIVKFFRSGEYRAYEQAVYLVRNYQTRDGSIYSDDWVSRMIRLRPDTHFEGSVHEALVPTPGKCKKLPAFVHHYGYAFENEEERRIHYERNVSILKRLMREEPDNLRWWLQIIPEYMGMRDSARLMSTAQEGLDKIQNIDKPFLNQCRGTFYCAILTGLAMEQRHEELLQLCHSYLQDSRNTFAANASLCVLGMSAANAAGQPEDMAIFGKEYFMNFDRWKKQPQTEQEQIISESILLVHEAFTEDNRRTMRLLYGQALLALGRAAEYPAELRAGFRNELAESLRDKADFLLLPSAYWELGSSGILPLEDLLLSLPLDQWMAQVLLLEQTQNQENWDMFQERLQTIRTREDVRYLYFTMHRVNAQLSDPSAVEDAEAFLRHFADAALAYAACIYTELALEGDMALLPEEIQSAGWVKRMLDCEPTDFLHRQEYLRNAVEIYPALDSVARQL